MKVRFNYDCLINFNYGLFGPREIEVEKGETWELINYLKKDDGLVDLYFAHGTILDMSNNLIEVNENEVFVK